MKGAATATASVPVLWSFLGYHFEAAPMLAGLAACGIVRVIIGFRTSTSTWREAGTNMSITLLTLLFASGVLLTLRPAVFYAIILGTGIGALGASLIKIAEKKARRLFDEDDDDVILDDNEAIRRLTEQVKDLK